jgi:hypothetical protein
MWNIKGRTLLTEECWRLRARPIKPLLRIYVMSDAYVWYEHNTSIKKDENE